MIRGSMDPVHERGSMDRVDGGGPWTRGPCFVLSQAYNVNESNEGPKRLLLKLRAASRLSAGKRKQISHEASMDYHCQ